MFNFRYQNEITNQSKRDYEQPQLQRFQIGVNRFPIGTEVTNRGKRDFKSVQNRHHVITSTYQITKYAKETYIDILELSEEQIEQKNFSQCLQDTENMQIFFARSYLHYIYFLQLLGQYLHLLFSLRFLLNVRMTIEFLIPKGY